MNSTTLRKSTDGAADCATGSCSYAYTDTTCSQGCSNGACLGCAVAGCEDTCPGMTAIWTGTNPMTFTSSGSTASRAQNYAPTACAAYSDGRDVVFSLTPPVSGGMTVKVTPSGWDAVLYTRSNCASGSELNCKDGGVSGQAESFSFWANAGSTYYAIVDGYSSAEYGNYTFTATLTPAAAAELCPGQDLTFSGNEANVSGDIGNYWSNYVGTGTCGNCTDGRDAVYHFVAPLTGNATVTLTPASFDAVVYVRSGSCASGSQLACRDAGAGGATESTTFTTTAGADYWVFVDMCSSTTGSYSLKVKY